MVTAKLQLVFGLASAEVHLENRDYGFVIKSLRSKADGFCILYTEGLSAHRQSVDEKNQGLEYIELYFLLPDYWDFSKMDWPVYWLNRIAQVPKKNKTWFGRGDTLPAGNPPQAVDEKLHCSYFMLSQPMLLESQLTGEAWKDTPFSMLAVLPIFEREFDYKNQNSARALLTIFQSKNISEMVDIYRKPVARKKFMGLF